MGPGEGDESRQHVDAGLGSVFFQVRRGALPWASLQQGCWVGEAVEVEFRVSEGRLQWEAPRSWRGSPGAGMKVAVELALDGVIERSEALARGSRVTLTE